MARERDNDLLPVQALTIIVWTALAHVNFLTAPRDIIAVSGRDSWLAVPLSFVLILLAIWIPLRVNQRFPDATLVEAARGLLGRALGGLVAVFYILYWLLGAGWLLRTQAHLLTTTLLTETPGWVLNVYFVLVTTYLVLHGLEPMARMFLLFVPLYAAPFLFVVLAGMSDADIGRLLPLLEDGVLPVLRGTWLAFVQGFGLSVLWMVLPHLRRRERALRAALVGIAFVALPASAANVVMLSMMGPREIAGLMYPTLLAFQLVELPGFTGFRLDPVFLMEWIAMAFSTVSALSANPRSSWRRRACR